MPVESVRGRYGGYRLASGYRMPPLMLSDDEALAVLLGLVAGRRAGLMTADGHGERDGGGQDPAGAARAAAPAGSTPCSDRSPSRLRPASPAPETGVLLTIADAVHHHRPVSIRYTAATAGAANACCTRTGSSPTRAGGTSRARIPAIGEDRTFRLDRIADARTLPGSFEPPAGLDPAQRVLSGLATAAVPA